MHADFVGDLPCRFSVAVCRCACPLRNIYPWQVDVELKGFSISFAMCRTLVAELRARDCWSDEIQRAFEKARDVYPNSDAIPLAELLIEFSKAGAPALWLYKQFVWGIGKILDDRLVSILAGSAAVPCDDTAELVTIDSAAPRQRKLMLMKYMKAMRRSNADSLNHTSVIDAGRTKSRQKRFYMAIGTPEKRLGWAPPQVFIFLFVEAFFFNRMLASMCFPPGGHVLGSSVVHLGLWLDGQVFDMLIISLVVCYVLISIDFQILVVFLFVSTI